MKTCRSQARYEYCFRNCVGPGKKGQAKSQFELGAPFEMRVERFRLQRPRGLYSRTDNGRRLKQTIFLAIISIVSRNPFIRKSQRTVADRQRYTIDRDKTHIDTQLTRLKVIPIEQTRNGTNNNIPFDHGQPRWKTPSFLLPRFGIGIVSVQLKRSFGLKIYRT